MPHKTTLSSDELERIMASVSPPVLTDREARRHELKGQSENRKSQWPNTLEAIRAKKDRWKKDKEESEEAARRKIDEEEMRLQKAARTKQIERATFLLNEQTDRMKTLRSKQLLVDVLHHRKIQLQEKDMLREQEEQLNRENDQQVLASVLKGEIEEEKAKRKVQKEHEELAVIQKQQLEEYKQRYIAMLREENRDGERTQLQAELDMKLEQERERDRRMKAKQASEETQLANLKLKAYKEVLKDIERQEDLKREEEERKKVERNIKREIVQKNRHDKIQARKQRMIDLATQNLVRLEAQNEERLENQSREVRAKQDKDLKDRADRRAAEKEATFRSRQNQLDHKKQLIGDEKQRQVENVKQWEEYGKRIEVQIRQEAQDVKLENLRFAVSQKQQADARRKTLMEARAADLLMDEDAKQTLAREDENFYEAARQALADSKKQGIDNVFPTKKAMAEKRVDLLAASGFRV